MLLKPPQLARREVPPNGYLRWAGLQRGMLLWGNLPKSEAREGEQVHDGNTLYVVVSNDRIHQRQPIAQVVPLTSSLAAEGDEESPFRQFRIRILKDHVTRFDRANPIKDIDMIALTDQVRVFAQVRLDPVPAGKLSKVAITNIEAGLRYVFNVP